MKLNKRFVAAFMAGTMLSTSFAVLSSSIETQKNVVEETVGAVPELMEKEEVEAEVVLEEETEPAPEDEVEEKVEVETQPIPEDVVVEFEVEVETEPDSEEEVKEQVVVEEETEPAPECEIEDVVVVEDETVEPTPEVELEEQVVVEEETEPAPECEIEEETEPAPECEIEDVVVVEDETVEPTPEVELEEQVVVEDETEPAPECEIEDETEPAPECEIEDVVVVEDETVEPTPEVELEEQVVVEDETVEPTPEAELEDQVVVEDETEPAPEEEVEVEETSQTNITLENLLIKGLTYDDLEFDTNKYDYTLNIVKADTDKNFIITPVVADDIQTEVTVTNIEGHEEDTPGLAIISANTLNDESSITILVGNEKYTINVNVANNSALEAPILAAQKLSLETLVSQDGNLISSSKKWVTSEAKNIYNTAINKAQNIMLDSKKTEEEIEAAIVTLANATKQFESATSVGLKAPYFGVLNISITGDVSYNGANKTIEILNSDTEEFEVTVVASNINTIIANSVSDTLSEEGVVRFTVPAPDTVATEFNIVLSLDGINKLPITFTVNAYQEKVFIPDAGLREALTEKGVEFKGKLAILSTLEPLEQLIANGYGIVDLEGLQHAINLKYIDLTDNEIKNINVLSKLQNLQTLIVNKNNVENFNLNNFDALMSFSISDEQITRD
ncbi:hypothetical protein AN641_01895 [Candidatus Epulonipiscioides gigas]|nr:hypothetical protein AN641_01895 [Epulopiscium sp. SCG-C07WGA-EpuloA2]